MATTGHESEAINIQGLKASLLKYKTSISDNKLDKITDLCKIAFGYGTCSTDSGTAAKTVSMSNFVLLNGGIVSVLFTKGITSANSTLNVNSTGAKSIYYHGAALTGGIITNNTVVILQYDSANSRWHIIGLEKIVRNYGNDWVDMGLPSGTLWAKTNLDLTLTNKFAASEYLYSCTYFLWGNTTGYNPSEQNTFDYKFSMENYDDTTGYEIPINTNIVSTKYDAAHVNLAGPWKMPTRNQIEELRQHSTPIDANGNTITTTSKLTTVNGIVGVYWKSNKNNNTIFFPACGRVVCSPPGTGSNGFTTFTTECDYWSSTGSSLEYNRYYRKNDGTSGGYIPYAYALLIKSNLYSEQILFRYNGMPIRPVM